MKIRFVFTFLAILVLSLVSIGIALENQTGVMNIMDNESSLVAGMVPFSVGEPGRNSGGGTNNNTISSVSVEPSISINSSSAPVAFIEPPVSVISNSSPIALVESSVTVISNSSPIAPINPVSIVSTPVTPLNQSITVTSNPVTPIIIGPPIILTSDPASPATVSPSITVTSNPVTPIIIGPPIVINSTPVPIAPLEPSINFIPVPIAPLEPSIDPPGGGSSSGGGSNRGRNNDEEGSRRIVPLSNLSLENLSTGPLTQDAERLTLGSLFSKITGAVIGVFGKRGTLGIGIFIVILGVAGLIIYNREPLGIVKE